MDSMTAMQAFTWADAAGFAALALAVVAVVGFAVAGFVQLRTAKIKAGQEDDLRQLVRRYEHLAEHPGRPAARGHRHLRDEVAKRRVAATPMPPPTPVMSAILPSSRPVIRGHRVS